MKRGATLSESSSDSAGEEPARFARVPAPAKESKEPVTIKLTEPTIAKPKEPSSTKSKEHASSSPSTSFKKSKSLSKAEKSQAALAQELEEKFKNRYTMDDPDFKETIENGNKPVPLVPEYQGNSGGRGGRGGGGGRRGGGRHFHHNR